VPHAFKLVACNPKDLIAGLLGKLGDHPSFSYIKITDLNLSNEGEIAE
jgi:hypothetical protein